MAGLRDKVVIITGASSGIGYSSALLLSSLGARLVVSGRNEENLQRLRTECLSADQHARVLVVVADVTSEKDLERLVKAALDEFKRVDVLVNNAAALEAGSIEDTSLEQYDRMMNVNLRSAFILSRLCVPHLEASRGCIVNVSSIAASRAFRHILAYSLSKAAMDQMTRCMALELASKQVRVNALNPGVIVTNIHRRSGMTEEKYAAFLERCKETHALGRPGTAEEVAQAIAFLADGGQSGFMTGNTIPIDGGRHAMCPR